MPATFKPARPGMAALLRATVLALGVAWPLANATAASAPERAAIFPFEFDDTSLQGEKEGERADQDARLHWLDTALREALVRSGRYVPVDPAAVAAAADTVVLRSCETCAADLARKLGAQVSINGWVQKVSNLILNINLVVRDAATGRVLRAGSVDMRGNTDETWSRALTYLLKNRILTGDAP
jgi:hypothetical protein